MNQSLLGDWGIEKNKYVYPLQKEFNVANHLRACVDLLDNGQHMMLAKVMRNDYLSNDSYISHFFKHVYMLKPYKSKNEWEKISKIMEDNYMLYWVFFTGLIEKEKSVNKIKYYSPTEKRIKNDLMQNFLQFINKYSTDYVLKGGAALLFCYKLTTFFRQYRFS